MGAAKRKGDKGDGNIDSPIGRAAILGRGAFSRHPTENTARRDIVLHETGEVFLTGSIELRMGSGLRMTVGPTSGTNLGAIVGPASSANLGATFRTTLGMTSDAVPIILFGPIFSAVVGPASKTSPYSISSTAFFLGSSIASSLALDATSSLTVATIVSIACDSIDGAAASMARGPFTDPVAMQRGPHGARRA